MNVVFIISTLILYPISNNL